MKKIINKIQSKFNAIAINAKAAATAAVDNARAEGFVDTGVKISSPSLSALSCWAVCTPSSMA